MINGTAQGPVPGSQWIRTPFYDLLFFSALWWLPACMVAYLGARSMAYGAAAFFIVYHVLLRLPHFMATMKTTYLNPDNERYYREHWLKYFVIPALIMFVYAVGSTAGADSTFKKALVTLSTCWGLQHISFQNYGILGIYGSRAGATGNERARRLMKAMFYMLFAAAAFEGVIRIWLSGHLAESTITIASRLVRLASLLSVLAYVSELTRVRKSHPISAPGLLFLLSAVGSTIYWPFYNSFGGVEQGSRIFFYVFNGHHCLCYLGLTFLMDCNKRQGSSGERPFDGGVRPYVKFLLPLIIVSVALMGGGWVLSSEGLFGSLGVLEGIFVAHYYIESNHWKFSDPHLRKTVLPLLRRPLKTWPGSGGGDRMVG